jgi:hypothetical protein
MDIIPSIYSFEPIGASGHGGLLPQGNIKLRFGEVKGEILPTDKESYSKLYREYEVLVQHHEGGSATHRMYHHCMVLSDLAGAADFSTQALRVSDQKDFQLGNGSRVFILCVEGNDARAIIIGGPQQHKDTSKGIHKEVEFNGVNFQVYEDGGWSLTSKGKTDNNGNKHPEADGGAGTQVKVEANGNFSVETPNGKCLLSIDHNSGDISIESDSKVTIKTSTANVEADSVTVKGSTIQLDSSSVGVGSNAAQPAVLGVTLATVLAQAFAVILPTLPTQPQQAALAAATGQLSTILSGSVRVAS